MELGSRMGLRARPAREVCGSYSERWRDVTSATKVHWSLGISWGFTRRSEFSIVSIVTFTRRLCCSSV